MTIGERSGRELTTPEIAELKALEENLRTWRNHWAEVERITADFPEDIRRALVLRPAEPGEALRQTLPQFAVLFHPDAQRALVEQLNDVLGLVERLIDAQT